MKHILQQLADSNRVLVAGSYARGEQNENSDIDFLIKTPRHCVIYGDRNENIDWVIKFLDDNNIRWNSTRNCYISTIGEDNNLEVQMEFYDGFYRNRKKLKTVDIMGMTFKTI